MTNKANKKSDKGRGRGHETFTIRVARPVEEVVALLHNTDASIPLLFLPGMMGARRVSGENGKPGALYAGQKIFRQEFGAAFGDNGGALLTSSAMTQSISEKFWVNRLTDDGLLLSYDNTEHAANITQGCGFTPMSDTMTFACKPDGKSKTIVLWEAPLKFAPGPCCLVALVVMTAGLGWCLNECADAQFNSIRNNQCAKIQNYLTRTGVTVSPSKADEVSARLRELLEAADHPTYVSDSEDPLVWCKDQFSKKKTKSKSKKKSKKKKKKTMRMINMMNLNNH